ncbi:MAG: endonuclease/exonuclease/phosphatase family protein [Phycisphaerales bacterium]
MTSSRFAAAFILLSGTTFAPSALAQEQGVRFGEDAPRPRTEGAIRIACYNMENVFDHVDDPDLHGEWDDRDHGISDTRARNLAAVIRSIDADIIALQEIESLDALIWFRDTYLADLGYTYAASLDVDYYRGIENSVLSRFEITAQSVRHHVSIDDVERPGIGWARVPANTTEPMEVQRSPLRVDIRVDDNYTITVFSVHHKSGNFKWKREAEAIRNVEWLADVAAENASRNILVMGDFNAAPWDKSLRLYLQAGFVDLMAHRTVYDEEGRLYKSHRSDRVIDFALANSAALREVVPDSIHIVGTYNPPDSWNWRTDPYPDAYASDHFPIVFDLIPADRR